MTSGRIALKYSENAWDRIRMMIRTDLPVRSVYGCSCRGIQHLQSGFLMVTRHRGYGGKREREPPHQDSTCIRDRIIGIVGRMVDRNERTGPGCSGSRRAGGGDSQRHGHLLRHKNGTGSDSASNGRLRDSPFFHGHHAGNRRSTFSSERERGSCRFRTSTVFGGVFIGRIQHQCRA